ncbi:teicoplanin resistance protein VanZ [Bacillaceae bacterium SAS-127]|nr:teicoplanin resistance protein VanZ [Bacillaceae bacterium SAS-127]
MSFDYVEYKEKNLLVPMEISNKKEYYNDLMNIEQSWTGRVDAQISNTFIRETIQLIINAISLFESGYFDCAFYSLRQSLEVSTTMVYLMELEPEKRESELLDWKKKSKFPMYGQMVKFLIANGDTFADMKKQMNDYFNRIQLVKERLNKHVHKQGFDTFYVSRNHIVNRNKNDDDLLNDFNYYTEICIGSIAILRLAIDPFPVLLMDEEIYSRTDDVLTEPYSENFIQKYIGKKDIEAYKKTKIYLYYHENFINEEKRHPSVVDIVKYQYIDKDKFDEILSQIHLLNKNDILAVFVTKFSEKVSKAYFYDGLLFYFTSTKSARESLGFDSRVLKNIKESDNHINNAYDEAYLSFIQFANEELFIEHNEKFTDNEINLLMKLLKEITNNS